VTEGRRHLGLGWFGPEMMGPKAAAGCYFQEKMKREKGKTGLPG
jgi:hypothetical protein